MSLIGLNVIHKKNGDFGIVKLVEVKFDEEKFKIMLTIEFQIDYDILTYKTELKYIKVI